MMRLYSAIRLGNLQCEADICMYDARGTDLNSWDVIKEKALSTPAPRRQSLISNKKQRWDVRA
jgi:hypothetical protein